MKREARQTRPQLVCVLADNSGSMYGPKAEAATNGIQEMLMQCQSTGPRGRDRSYFRFLLIRFGNVAEVDQTSYMKPVREIDPDSIRIEGTGGGTNMVQALEIACSGLADYVRRELPAHPERAEHPLPLVLLFSDGFNNAPGDPVAVADRIKALNLDGEGITIACAGVATQPGDQPDEQLLRRIASPECYVHIQDVRMLSSFLAEVGSCVVSSPAEVAAIIKRIECSAPSAPPPDHAPVYDAPAPMNGSLAVSAPVATNDDCIDAGWEYSKRPVPSDEYAPQRNPSRIEDHGRDLGAWHA